MDPRSPYPHHSRYVHRPPPPPPSPSQPIQQHLPTNPNFQHSNLLPAPQIRPPPPPAPPQSRHLGPTPPQSFNLQNSQFTYSPNPNHQLLIHHNDAYRPRSHPEFPNFSELPRVLHRPAPFNDDVPHGLPDFDRYISSTSRVLTDNWPVSPVAKIRHELQADFGRADESRHHHHHRQGLQFGSGSDRSSRDFHVVSNQSNHTSISRVFESNTRHYDNRCGDFEYDYVGGVSLNQRWVHDREREVMRDALIEIRSNEIGNGDGNGIRLVAGKREHHRSRETNAEFERHSSRGSREGSHEFNWTPRKQIQKKSALLRIQKPNYRKREDERVHYSGYFDNTKPSSFRGKDQDLHLDCVVGEEIRQGSPVELDVSFKSNSLVAKAIVTPPTGSAAASDTNSTPGNSKIRKVLVPDKDASNSPITKTTEATKNLENSVRIEHIASSNDKDPKQSEEKGTASGAGCVYASSSLTGSNRTTNALLEKNRVGGSTKGTVSVKGGTNPVSRKTSSIKVVKKKKIVKKIAKKFVNPNLNSSSPVKTRDKPLKADDSVPNPPASSEPDKAAAMVYSVDLQPSLNEVSIIPNNDKVEGFAKAMASEKVGTSADSGESMKSNIKRKRNCSMSPLSSPGHDESKFVGALVNGSSVNVHDISDTDKDFTKSLNETIGSDIDSQNGDSILLKDNSLSPMVLLSVENNADLGLLGSEKIICREGAITSCVTTMAFDNDLINSQEGIPVSDFGTLNVECKQPCTNQRGPPVENGLPSACIPVISSDMLALLNSGKTRIKDVATFADCSNNGLGTNLGSDNGFSNSEEIKISSLGTCNDIFKQPYPDGVTTSLENVLIGRSLNTMVSRGGSDDNAFNIEENCKKVEMPQLDLSRSEVTNMCLEPVKKVSSAHWVDTTLRLSFKDPIPAEFTDPRDGCMDDCFQPSTNGLDVSQQSSSTDVSEAKVSVSGSVNVNPNLPGNGKRKLSDFQLELCCPITNNNERPVVTGISSSGGVVHSNFGSGLTQPEEEVVVSYLDPLSVDVPFNSGSGLKQPEEDIAVSCVDSPSRDVPFNSGNGLTQLEEEVVVSCMDLAFPKAQSPCLSELGCKQIVNATPIMAGSCCQSNSMDIDTGEGEKMDVNAAKSQVIGDSGNAQCQIAAELVSPDERLSCIDVESNKNHGVKDDFPSTSNNLASVGDDNGVSTMNSCDELMEFAPDMLANVASPEMLPAVLDTSPNKISIEKVSRENKISVEEPAIQADSNLSTHTSHSQNVKVVLNTDNLVECNHSLTREEGPLPSQDSRDTIQPLNFINGESYGRKNQPSPAVSRIYPGRVSFVFTASKTTASSTHMRKPRTWHRSNSSSVAALPGNKTFSSTIPAQGQWPKKVTKFQSNSYIRKGNSLVRKPALTAQSEGLIRLNHWAGDEAKQNVGSDNRTDLIDQPNFVTMGGMHASFERPRTPPLPIVSKMPNHSTSSLQDCLSSPLAEPLHNDSNETAPVPVQCTEGNDVPKSSEDVLKTSETPPTQTSQINNLECQHELKDGNMVSSNVKSITYVKRKSNQLVATSNACASSMNTAQNTLSSDGYYKRRKNQLIRTSLESQVKHTVSMSDASLNAEGQTALNVISGRIFSKKRLRKVVTKTRKPSKFSLVWTLRGAQLANSNGDSLTSQVLPHLFPWKRATYWRSVMPNSAFNSNNSSLSTIRKLLLLRKRDAVYTRSKHGFSLRKSKVLSVGGSSLKWSKSIERHSKKANEEATLAVAAAERKKREQRGAAHVVSRTKSRNSSRERIFRIGSVRYKMDSSGRTLQRISDDESSCSELQTEKDAKRSYVPRRLMIGKDEYVQIGNGNQLVRDPKKRTRILASEKVRWSLHTARSRLARRRKYCQFFTRFGKCNKEDGKCPYIHDSSKIAVCTKFLNGLCLNPDCKLTHKVIPERMPDCSYFLQGLCTNKSCPYRHVHVNPNAAACEGFLRGYCADGNECRKKHSYVCPIYEATGSCPQGSKCKLHHPKNRSKGKKCKQMREKKNAQGRYFGSMHAIVSEPRTAVSGKHPALDNGICFEGRIADYISLDISDEEVVENNPMDEQETVSDGDPLDLQFGDLDELIKPVRIMNIL